jgi:hypothetical protein
VARNQTERADQYCQNRKTSHRASFFKFAHADSLWLSCNFDPKERKLYLIMPSGLRASIWSRHLAHAGALHRPTLIFRSSSQGHSWN